MVRTLIGTATTDERGIATFTYTGTGAGEVDFVATNDDGSILSEIYEVLDCSFIDNGILSDYNDTGWTVNGLTVTRGDEYTTLQNSLTVPTSLYRDIPFNSVIEFDKIGTSNLNLFVFGDRNGTSFSNDVVTNMATFTQNDCHIKIVFEENKFSVYADGTLVRTNVSHSISSNPSFRFQINQNGNDILYKNFKIYPI